MPPGRFVCQCCTRAIQYKQLSVVCGDCSKTFHASCVDLTLTDLNYFKENSMTWSCSDCMQMRRRSRFVGSSLRLLADSARGSTEQASESIHPAASITTKSTPQLTSDSMFESVSDDSHDNPVSASLRNFLKNLEDSVVSKIEPLENRVLQLTGVVTSQNELDLDFLERRHNAGNSDQSQDAPRSPIEISPDSVDRVKVILLGASAVGKTSIIQQFVWNDFCEEYVATDRKHTYYPSVITNDRLYEIKISDLPVIPYFPVNSYYEWANYRYYGLRSATAYILVFDLANVDTFQYVKTLREQICESRNMANVPILVVGNKQDLMAPEDGCGVSSSSSKPAITSGMEERRRDIVNLVRKHWKCGYIECSAKYNWKVVAVFKELINMVDSLESRDQSPMLDNIQDALDRNKCVLI